MNKKNIKLLIIVLIALIAIWGISEYWNSKNKRTFKKYVVEVTPSEVYVINIFKNNYSEKFSLIKENNKWFILDNKNKFVANYSTIENLLKEFEKMKTKRVVAKNKKKWEKYSITDSLATKVILLDKSKNELCELVIGKFDYKANQNNMQGRPSYEMMTYVRNKTGKTVYSIEGALAMTVKNSVDNWRDKTVMKFNPNNINSIKIKNIDGSELNIAKQDTIWKINNNINIEESKVTNYLNSIKNLNGQQFENNFKANSEPVASVIIEGKEINLETKIYKSD